MLPSSSSCFSNSETLHTIPFEVLSRYNQVVSTENAQPERRGGAFKYRPRCGGERSRSTTGFKAKDVDENVFSTRKDDLGDVTESNCDSDSEPGTATSSWGSAADEERESRCSRRGVCGKGSKNSDSSGKAGAPSGCGKKRNRKRPLELSSKAPVAPPSAPRLTKAAPRARDPRFSSLSAGRVLFFLKSLLRTKRRENVMETLGLGETDGSDKFVLKYSASAIRCGDGSGTFNPDLFSKAYAFCDELRAQERRELIQKLRNPERPLSEGARERLKRRLNQMESVDHHRRQLSAEIELKRKLTNDERRAVAETGKKPFIHSRGRIKHMLQEAKFEELTKTGRLEKHLIRKRKKQLAKEHYLIPKKRTAGE